MYERWHVSVAWEQLRMRQMKMKEAETNVWHDKDLESIHKKWRLFEGFEAQGWIAMITFAF